MHQAFKFRAYPTATQKAQLANTFGACRYIYNWGLALKTEQYTRTGKSDSYASLCKKLTALKADPETVWLNEVSSACLQQSLRNLETAFTNFFKGRTRHPKFHSKRSDRGSARHVQTAFQLKDGELYLAKHASRLKIKWSRKLPSEPVTCTVSVTPSGKYFVSFLCEVTDKSLPHSEDQVGLDVGLTDFVVESNGRKHKLPRQIKGLRGKLAKAHRRMAKKQKGSRNRAKARVKVARIHERIGNIRRDFLHKLSTRIIHENQVVVLEDLNIKGMLKNRKLSRAISEQGWAEFRAMLEYKGAWYGRQVHVCDRFFPSSKTCSTCGKVKSKMPLNIREWTCECGATHDRDVNAAKNILAAGTVVAACGEDGRPKANYVGSRQSSSKQESPSFRKG